ncbi:hypothetical protein NBRC10512_003211 [Rhodotorula toruloides]|uniref:RHTO0S05e07822g1_1 n=2 Tax=Rhodotorula toruloides TaxID=5286 RepID=A0A061AT70_RHOTO|nr:Sfi1 spindle body domain protein [Rhodotorula toruloides NP11]EMS23804.1 Sfi1 spindle body domain protein [Rhodotorula toruloides NP11]CDR40839.1 RHTO0S05e07822g1_1 [Rhodotorula toruloides]
MAPHPGDDSQTQSSTLEPFPPLSSSQRTLINHTLALLAHDAHTWADLTHAQGVLQRDGHASADEIERLYEVWLRMVWVEGTTWHDKWDAVQRQWEEAEVDDGQNAVTPLANRRGHRRRPSDNLDLLRRKLDTVALDPPQPHNSAPRPLPPRTRPKSTPPRQLLVRSAQEAGGYSSSDDQFVGVPTPPTARASRLALPPRTERVPFSTTDDDAPDQTTRRRRFSSTTAHQVLTSTPRPSARPPSPPSPEPTPLPTRSDAHPLLSRRLSALRPRSSSPTPSPRPPSSSSSMLISSTLSPPEALSLALSFDRLRLLMPLLTHWKARVRFVREREGELVARREGWLRRCGWEQWVGRVGRVREGTRKAEEWRKEQDERRLSRTGRRKALGGAFAAWKVRWLARLEVRQAAEREEARKEKEAALREARDAVLSFRYRGLAVRSLREWRIRCATKRVDKVLGAGLQRRAVEKWVRRVADVRHRAQVMEEVADEKWAEAEDGRKRERWAWWVRRTALRVKEAEWVGAKEEALRREGWEWWREMKQRRDHVRHLEQVASAHDARHLAHQTLTTWRTRTAHLVSLSSLASSHAHTLLTRRASSQLTHWRLSLRLRLALRVRADSLLSTSLSHWLDAYEHVQIELEGRADALIATRDTRVGGVALEVWRSAVAHRVKLQGAAETYSRLRSVARGLEKWKRRWEVERVREKKAEVVRDFFVTRRAWRRWSEEVWERKRATWEVERRRKRAKETLDYWLTQLRQRRRDRELVTQLQRQQGQRLLAASLEQWKLAVVLRKEDEVEARDWRDRKLVRDGFRRWAQQTVKAEERILRAASFRSVKLEELRDRLFHAWLSSSRRSAALRVRLDRFDTSRRRKTLEAAFDCWREGSLRRSEEQVQRRRAQRERGEAWAQWKSRTKTVAAIQLYNRLLASHALLAWQAWTPPADLTRRAIEADEGSVIGGAFQVWKIKTGAKKALRSYSGRLRLGSSPSAASSPLASPARPSPARASSNTSSTLSSTPSRSLWGTSAASASTAATSYRPALATPASSAGASPYPAPSVSARPQTASTSAFTSAASRRRLSAEIAVNKPAPPRQPDAGKRERRRSIVSVLSSRSAPSGGASLFASRVSGNYDDSDEEDAASVGREGKSTRSEGGADVRGRHEALRARLRAAAAAASSR